MSNLYAATGIVAVVAGLILIVSGISSGSLLLVGLKDFDKYFGASIIPEGNVLLQLAIAALTFVVGLGGILVVIGGLLFLRNHGFTGRLLIGLGGGTAVFGLLFSMAYALYVSGLSAPVFHQSYFTLYWFGSILATVASLLSRRARSH